MTDVPPCILSNAAISISVLIPTSLIWRFRKAAHRWMDVSPGRRLHFSTVNRGHPQRAKRWLPACRKKAIRGPCLRHLRSSSLCSLWQKISGTRRCTVIVLCTLSVLCGKNPWDALCDLRAFVVKISGTQALYSRVSIFYRAKMSRFQIPADKSKADK